LKKIILVLLILVGILFSCEVTKKYRFDVTVENKDGKIYEFKNCDFYVCNYTDSGKVFEIVYYGPYVKNQFSAEKIKSININFIGVDR
jgi:GTPase